MKLYPIIEPVILEANKAFIVKLIIENDEEEEFNIVPLIELEIGGKTRMIFVSEAFNLKPLEKRELSMEMKVPNIEGIGKIYFILESNGKELVRREKPIAVIKNYRDKPLFISFVWHHHQAPNYLPDGSFHSLWAFKHVYEGDFYGFGKGGPYNIHKLMHQENPSIIDNDHFSPSLLEQWSIVLEDTSRYEKSLGSQNLGKIKEVLEFFQKMARNKKIELLGSMFAHSIQGFLVRKFTLNGFGEFIKELLKWEWTVGLKISERVMGVRPRGAWTPEMFWSMELLPIYNSLNIKYTVLCEQHFRLSGGDKDTIYEPYILEDLITGNKITIFFRDLELSNWISFKVDFMDEEEADTSAREFIIKLFERYLKYPGKICVIALDGENWMILPQPKKYSAYFLGRIWKYIGELKGIFQTIALSEYLKENPAEKTLYYIPYGSWISLSEKQWIGGVKDTLWRNIIEKIPWIEAYYMIIPETKRLKLLYDENTPLYKMMKALSISLDSDYYWYAEEKVYQNAINMWLKEAYRIARQQLSKIDISIVKERNDIVIIEIQNRIEHDIKLNVVLKHRDEVIRKIHVLIPTLKKEQIYLPIIESKGCEVGIYASKVLIDSYKIN